MADGRGRVRAGGGRARPGAHFIAERLLLSIREELARADAKASILLSVAVAVLVVVLAAPRDDLPSALTSVGLGLWTAGVVMIAAVVLPRSKGGPRLPGTVDEASFFADLTGRTPTAELLPRIARAGRDPERWLVSRACELGAILAVKYRWLKWGCTTLTTAGILLVLAWSWR